MADLTSFVVTVFVCHNLYSLCSSQVMPSKTETMPSVVIEKLFENMDTMQKRIEQLENNEKAMKQSIINLIGTDAQLRIQIQDLVCKADDSKGKDDDNDSVVKTSNHGQEIVTKRGRTKRQFSGTVAFTAYLDHLVKVGNDQPVVYNRIILNEGNGYSNNTGTFRAPVTGIYMFSWAVTARRLSGQHAYDVWVKLMLNGNHMTGTVAESRQEADDNQGSNTAVLRLIKGDEVWTAHYSSAPDIYGDDNERSTSFTGALLFQEEEGVVPIGK